MTAQPGEDKRDVSGLDAQAAYQAINHHWAHAEQERWSILYNFLMASTILLLAWATLFGATQSTIKTVVLALLSLGGIAISGLWITIGCRVNTFIKRYGELGEEAEVRLGIGEIGPFHGGEGLRREERRSETGADILEWVGSLIPSRYFVVIIPSVFALIYLVLFVLSFLL